MRNHWRTPIERGKLSFSNRYDPPTRRMRFAMSSNEFRHWFLTWTTYGSRMPGDARGSTGETRGNDGSIEFHNRIGTLPSPPNESIERHAHWIRKHPVVILDTRMANIVERQLFETAEFRCWMILILAIMPTHIHIVLQVPGDPSPSQLLKDLKSYASRRLNQHDPQRSGRWWTDSGSARFLAEEANVLRAIAYVRNQPNPLIVREC